MFGKIFKLPFHLKAWTGDFQSCRFSYKINSLCHPSIKENLCHFFSHIFVWETEMYHLLLMKISMVLFHTIHCLDISRDSIAFYMELNCTSSLLFYMTIKVIMQPFIMISWISIFPDNKTANFSGDFPAIHPLFLIVFALRQQTSGFVPHLYTSRSVLKWLCAVLQCAWFWYSTILPHCITDDLISYNYIIISKPSLISEF
jgi:hypothetical protein